ncbi:ParB/RepB/Spo0J family partition protein [Cyanobacteria bacterium FACHB-472]|nr:ParB/RepB/Spo0J family partition protein [Cyanobacteria bacterium FACHB-472]
MNAKRDKPYSRRLKGIDAFIGEPAATTMSGQLVPIEKIQSQEQPRRYFDPQKLEQLVQSVKEHGILEPLLVRPLSSGEYGLVAGERRYRAARAVGLSEVPVVVRSLSDSEALQLALIENLQREDLNPIEQTEGILQLLSLKLGRAVPEVVSLLYRMQNAVAGKITDNVISNSESEGVKEIFAGLGLMEWESFTANRLPLLRLPEEILEALRSGRIEYTKAKAIARLKSAAERQSLLEEAIAQNLSLSEIRKRLKAFQRPTERGELLTRMETTYKKAKKSKVWENPKKRKKLESLLAGIETLLVELD